MDHGHKRDLSENITYIGVEKIVGILVVDWW